MDPAPPELADGLRGRRGVSAVGEPYEALRPKAFAIAYRMLGSAAEAEDVVQEAFLRVHRELEAGEPIASLEAFTMTVVTRLAIDELRSARARRERYVGEWLPEPVVTDGEDDPAAHAELSESLGLAFLVLLESLSPEQRAVYLLHDVFDYRYDEIASILGKSAAAVRQLAVRARRHVDERRPRFESSPEQRERLAERFFAAVRARRRRRAWRRSWRRTSSSTATVAARCPPSPGPRAAVPAWRGPCWRGRAPARASAASRCGASTSTASPARSRSTATAVSSASWRSTSAVARCSRPLGRQPRQAPAPRAGRRLPRAARGDAAPGVNDGVRRRGRRRRGREIGRIAPGRAGAPGSRAYDEGHAPHPPAPAGATPRRDRVPAGGRRPGGRVLRRPGPGHRRDRPVRHAQRARQVRRRDADAVRVPVALAPDGRQRLDDRHAVRPGPRVDAGGRAAREDRRPHAGHPLRVADRCARRLDLDDGLERRPVLPDARRAAGRPVG